MNEELGFVVNVLVAWVRSRDRSCYYRFGLLSLVDAMNWLPEVDLIDSLATS